MAFLIFIALFLSVLAYVPCVPTVAVAVGDIEARDEPPLQFNIDPDIKTSTGCGNLYVANINVKFAPNLIFTSGACDAIRNFIGGNDGDMDAEVIFLCPNSGPDRVGNLDTKFLLSLDYSVPVDMSKKGEQKIPANLEVVNTKAGFLVETDVYLGGIADKSKNEIKYQFIYCVSIVRALK